MLKSKAIVGLAALISCAAVGKAQAFEGGSYAALESYTWKEKTSCGTLVETGPRLAGGGHVSGAPLAPLPALRLRFDAQVALGLVDYDTAVQSGSFCIPVDTETFYAEFKTEGSVAWRLVLGDSRLEPFLGLAFRTWLRDILDTDSVQGYPEYYRLLYGRLGLRLLHEAAEDLRFTGTFSIDPMLVARETIDWEGITGETLQVKNGERVGWTLEAGAHMRQFDLTAYWQAVRLGESNSVSCNNGLNICLQPESEQDIVGFRFGFVF